MILPMKKSCSTCAPRTNKSQKGTQINMLRKISESYLAGNLFKKKEWDPSPTQERVSSLCSEDNEIYFTSNVFMSPIHFDTALSSSDEWLSQN